MIYDWWSSAVVDLAVVERSVVRTRMAMAGISIAIVSCHDQYAMLITLLITLEVSCYLEMFEETVQICVKSAAFFQNGKDQLSSVFPASTKLYILMHYPESLIKDKRFIYNMDSTYFAHQKSCTVLAPLIAALEL